MTAGCDLPPRSLRNCQEQQRSLSEGYSRPPNPPTPPEKKVASAARPRKGRPVRHLYAFIVSSIRVFLRYFAGELSYFAGENLRFLSIHETKSTETNPSNNRKFRLLSPSVSVSVSVSVRRYSSKLLIDEVLGRFTPSDTFHLVPFDV